MGRISSKVSSLEIIRIKREKRRIAKIPADGRWIAVIRIRGTVNRRREVNDTLAFLRLHKPNHAVVIPLTESYKGMLLKVQNTIAWGEINFETFKMLLAKRGRVRGNKKLNDEIIKELSEGKIGGIEELASKLWNKELSFKDLKWLKPVFRLNPPSGGYRGSVKKSFETGGAYGYWGERINELIERMV
ncbi:MAG: 50S ribosomal protein L30 [Candidatus Njordarchaeia archaeon]